MVSGEETNIVDDLVPGINGLFLCESDDDDDERNDMSVDEATDHIAEYLMQKKRDGKMWVVFGNNVGEVGEVY